MPVWHFKDAPAPIARLHYTERDMCVLPWQRVVLYDVELGRDDPRSMLVAYDMEGGLSAETASHARRHFEFLANEWEFKHNSTGTSPSPRAPAACISILRAASRHPCCFESTHFRSSVRKAASQRGHVGHFNGFDAHTQQQLAEAQRQPWRNKAPTHRPRQKAGGGSWVQVRLSAHHAWPRAWSNSASQSGSTRG